MARPSIAEEIVEYVRKHPGAQSQTIVDVFPHVRKATIQNTLSRMQRVGVLENRGGSGNRWTPPAEWYYITPSASEYSRELARDIYAEMKTMHSSVHEEFLAEKLDELFFKGES